ncbi:hypothetical protein EJ02DRAFT_447036 [Clathrospora elynae]|uniref:PH domain-containing protein n=1 Tax=Clathrospora elynae TaxID=706981 RepID=A0A6A5SDI6_9PLEO|nr:hypothetical protein EJ02DRAFT_447036 [Clathrospora elynae]
MATANPPLGALPLDTRNASDPFLAHPHDAHRQRYSAFDNSQFSLYLNGSPMQAKRALQAHLAETTRRLQETSHLGNALVHQRKELEDKLQEVEHQQQEDDIGPELRQRLAELEKEFNEVGRETARAFLPKSRVPSGETDTGGASVYSSEAHHSPTKVSVPSRKQRNQQPSRINDIALATEISTSLLSQLKDLQAVLLQKDDALKAADLDRSQLEIEVEGLSQRLRTLDESESRLKDVNWNLETQVRESEAQSKSAAEKEHRLNYALNLARTERSTLEREFEELKQIYAKLNDDHINKTRQHENELSTLRRSAAMTETEKGAMLRKVEELTAKNHELAQAVAYRMRSEEHAHAEDTSPDDGGEEGDSRTPEHSPPPSPNKATPRHGMLESETLKHSLQHAHRMIQQLKNNIHREKTEKIELKRMLQDARDELDTNRSLNGPASAGKRKKNDKDAFKKPARPDRLGALRAGTQEVLVDDEDWEEQEGMPSTPSRRPNTAGSVQGAVSSGFNSAAEPSTHEGFENANDTSDAFETANDTSDAAFETANERDGMTTESDAFQTGAETLDGDSSDQLTETEAGPSQATARHSRPSVAKGGRLNSYENFRTPNQNQHARFRLKSGPNSSRRSTPRGGLDFLAGTPPISKDSPASFSLFAELNDLSGDDDDEDEDGSFVEGTPSRSSVLFSPNSSPDALRNQSQSSMMTEPEPPKPITMSSIWTQDTQPQAPRLAALQLSSFNSQSTSPQAAPRPDLRFSTLSSQNTEPKCVPLQDLHPRPPHVSTLALSLVSAQGTTPQTPPAPVFNFSSLHTQDTSPRAIPNPRIALAPSLGMSALSSHSTEPVAPTVEETTAPSLDISSISHQTTEPREAVASRSLVPATLLASTISSQATEPTEQAGAVPSVQKLTATPSDGIISSPVRDSQQAKKHVPLQMSSLSVHSTEPRDVTQKQVSLQMSNLSSHATEPRDVPRPPLSALSATSSQATEPLAPRRDVAQLSQISSYATEPVAPRLPRLQLSEFSSRSTEPVEVPKSAPRQISSLSFQTSHPVEPSRPAASFFSPMTSQTTEPVAPQKMAPPTLSVVSSQATEPVQPRQRAPPHVSVFSAQHTEPVALPVTPQSEHHFSDVRIVQDTQPESPTLPAFLPHPTSRPATANHIRTPTLELSPLVSQDTEPSVTLRPVTAHRTIPVLTSTNSSQTETGQTKQPSTLKLGFFDSTTVSTTGSRDGRIPLTPISVNGPSKIPRTPVADGGTQTMVSAEQIDKLLLARTGLEKSLSPPGSPLKKNSNEPGRTPRRPGSSGSSIRSRAATPPPLPRDHKEVIAAAALKPMPPGTPGVMGPPMMPASAYKKRPTTPSIKTSHVVVTPKTGGTTPRAGRHLQPGDTRSGASSPLSRRSSLSSFTSELDQRFNMTNGPSFTPTGVPAGTTDPRMIQAITQTMIGEYLWKYTRKTGREGMSENRHRRFFWIHPYTRTLYWSDRDPQSADKTTLKAKSVAIESVQEIDDGNPLPPGLHQKSLLVITPGRSMKFTAATGQRHETWYNALNYLCQRVDEVERQQTSPQPQQELKPAAVDEIQAEFNPSYRSSSRQTGRSRASMTSYTTRRTSSPHHAQLPTLRQSTVTPQRAPSTEPPVHASVSSRFSTILRPSASAMRGSFSSRRSKISAQESSTTYEEPSHSNMELSRDIHEHVEREQDFMPNVRACCDGKHDVAHLHQHSVKDRHPKPPSSRPSLFGSMSSRAQSRTESRTESRTDSRTESRTASRTESHNESRNERIRHETEMEAANFGAGA